ncbi:DUF262 domain-containing protein [Maioricimonas sp. JC845]|uniref:GmrSD restriction endonuclease domain-containing protein n=1 Tax=Maioricimonas sp. JC845 TaxID=3232138 RepID=UPI00345A84AB
MSKAIFQTNPISLETLLRDCESGKIQLPDFQRSWVWAEDRILELIASVSRAFPIGALMTLETDPETAGIFARRPVEGTPLEAEEVFAGQLLLDGQQRMTSLYQTCMRQLVVRTISPKKKLLSRWFYIDISKALGDDALRESAIFSIPEDRVLRTNFNKDVVLDLSTREAEYEQLMFPVNQVFDWDTWQEEFGDYWIDKGEPEKRKVFREFKDRVLQNFKSYQVPVITLDSDTSHEAVCLVFEKVNTGGKPLDAFELLTAMYAARGEKLRDYWLGTPDKPGLQVRLSRFGRAADQKEGVLAKVASTDVLQAIALLHTKDVRNEKASQGVRENELPAVRATRQSLLSLPVEAYLKHRDAVEKGFQAAAKFLRQQSIYRVLDLPYQTQLVPLAAIFAELGDQAEHAAIQQKIARWYWCGVFGELYGSAVESRFARDIVEVPAWLAGGSLPSTVTDGVFRAERLFTIRNRQSAAYKGIHALLMKEGAKDFRTGQAYDATIFFDEAVDIHHIFPEKWCKDQNINVKRYDCVLNKTPLSYRTNRIIGGVAPSKYLDRIEAGRTSKNGQVQDPPLDPAVLDEYLRSHCISPEHLRADDFEGFLEQRRRSLLQLIANATGHTVSEEIAAEDEGEELTDELARDTTDSPRID